MSTRLLVVDDDPPTLLAFSDALRFRLADTTIVTASTGEEALALLAREPYELVISDVCMPGMNGLELFKRITNRYPSTLVFLVTGCEAGLGAEARGLGVTAFIEKPVVIRDLVPLVQEALQKAIMLRRLHESARPPVSRQC
jgi:two-component system response regulator AauR